MSGVPETPHARAVRRLDLEPLPESVPAARALLRALIEDTAFRGRLEDGELALSEMVTNAVLHGRAPLVLTLVLEPELLRVEVEDGNAVSPSFSVLDQTAVTGRGLLLISAVSDRWGVDPSDTGKTVWFELVAGRDAQTELDVDALLASWADELAQDPAEECVRIVLTDLDVPLVARAEAHVEALLRELTLVVAAGTASADERRVAGNALAAAAAVDPVRAELRAQLSLAVARGAPRTDVTVSVRRGEAEGVRDLVHALDEADRLSRTGRLLLVPAPVELSDARRGYLRRMLAQLGS